MPAREVETGRGSFPDSWLLLPLAIIVGAGVVPPAIGPVNGDASWYLYMAGRVLDGARPYVDVVDTNPPLIVVLSLGVVLPARVLGVSPLRLFPMAVVGLIVGSMALAWRLARGLPDPIRQAALLATAYGLFVGAGPAFGQREHLTLILIVPYAWAPSPRPGATGPRAGSAGSRGSSEASASQ